VKYGTKIQIKLGIRLQFQRLCVLFYVCGWIWQLL